MTITKSVANEDPTEVALKAHLADCNINQLLAECPEPAFSSGESERITAAVAELSDSLRLLVRCINEHPLMPAYHQIHGPNGIGGGNWMCGSWLERTRDNAVLLYGSLLQASRDPAFNEFEWSSTKWQLIPEPPPINVTKLLSGWACLRSGGNLHAAKKKRKYLESAEAKQIREALINERQRLQERLGEPARDALRTVRARCDRRSTAGGGQPPVGNGKVTEKLKPAKNKLPLKTDTTDLGAYLRTHRDSFPTEVGCAREFCKANAIDVSKAENMLRTLNNHKQLKPDN